MPFVLRDILEHGQKALKFRRVSAKLLNHGASDLQAEQMSESASEQKTPQDGAIKPDSAPVPAQTSAAPQHQVINISVNVSHPAPMTGAIKLRSKRVRKTLAGLRA